MSPITFRDVRTKSTVEFVLDAAVQVVHGRKTIGSLREAPTSPDSLVDVTSGSATFRDGGLATVLLWGNVHGSDGSRVALLWSPGGEATEPLRDLIAAISDLAPNPTPKENP